MIPECWGRMRRSDAEFVKAFADHVAEISSRDTHLYEDARKAGRIAYCTVADARQEERRQRILLAPEDEYPHHVVE